MIKYLIGFVILSTFASCSTQESADLEYFAEARFNLPSGLNTIETHVFIIEDVNLFLSANLASDGYDISNISSISPGRAELYTAFSGFNLNFIQDVSVTVRLSQNPNDNKELFKLDNVRLNEDSNIALLNTLVDLTDDFKKENVDLEVRLKLRSPSPTTIPLVLNFSYAVFISE